MSVREYSVVLDGVDAFDLPAAVLRDVCTLLVEGSQRSARLLGEGRSVARGTAPAWLATAADVRLTRFDRGSLDLGVRAPSLAEVAPELFGPQLFPVLPDPDATAFDLLMGAVQDATDEKVDSELLDAGVLEVLANSAVLFAGGGTRLTLQRVGGRAVHLDAAIAGATRRLVEGTPAPRVARVRGTLDSVTVSTRAITLRLEEQRLLRGFAGSAISLDDLKAHLGTDVVVEGEVTYRPSGEPLRVQVDSLSPARAGDSIWARLPRAEARSARARPVQASSLDALFGAWPGEESDADLARALEDLG